MSVRPGTRLDGRYRLADRLAYGGMGEVWRAMDEVLSREVAVKILRPELAEDEAFVRRFRAEARTTSGLPHNGIAAVYDYGETRVGGDGQSPAPYDDPDADPVAYLVMELVPGEALSSMLSRDGALGPDRTLDLVAQAARALHAAHQRGVIHRDIKPANLMVTPDGRVKVTDFGIARPLDHEPLTATGQVMGTAHYLAPELAKGQDASPLSDVYALGVVAYECLAGHRPFEGDNQVAVALAHLNEQPPPLPGTIPPQVRSVVGSAMEKEPQRRMPSAEAFAAALETLRYRQGGAADNGDDHLTPGTGILPGSSAWDGLAAAGLSGGQYDWTPGNAPDQEGTAATALSPAPVPSTGTQSRAGAQGAYGDARYAEGGYAGQEYGRDYGAQGYEQAGHGRAGYERGEYGQAGYDQAGYDQGGYDRQGYDQGGYRQGGYGGPPDPFRTPTAAAGIALGDEEQRPRSIGTPILLLAALATVVVVVLVIGYFANWFGAPAGTTLDPAPTTTGAPAVPGPSDTAEPATTTSATRPTSRRPSATTTTRSPSSTSRSPSSTSAVVPPSTPDPTPTQEPPTTPEPTPTPTPPSSSSPPSGSLATPTTTR